MTSDQYKSAIAALGLTQAGAAVLFGVALRTSSGWACGDYRVPRSVAMLLELFADNPKLIGRFNENAA